MPSNSRWPDASTPQPAGWLALGHQRGERAIDRRAGARRARVTKRAAKELDDGPERGGRLELATVCPCRRDGELSGLLDRDLREMGLADSGLALRWRRSGPVPPVLARDTPERARALRLGQRRAHRPSAERPPVRAVAPQRRSGSRVRIRSPRESSSSSPPPKTFRSLETVPVRTVSLSARPSQTCCTSSFLVTSCPGRRSM